MAEQATTEIPARKEVSPEHQWDLSKLYENEDQWESDFKKLKEMLPEIESFRGTLGTSASHLKKCLEFNNRLELLEERLGHYAHLRLSEDAGDSQNQARFARFVQVATDAETRSSYQAPEIQAIPDEKMNTFLESAELAEFRIVLKKLLRFKPHILSEKEERLLAMQEEANQTAQKSFSALTDVDMEFGHIETPEGRKPLSQASYNSFLLHQNRDLRKQAFKQFHGVYVGHRNTLANLYAGSVHLDVYRARARNFGSARAARLFPDDVPESVYDSLVRAVNDNLGPLHDYYKLRARQLGLEKLHLYDTKVPLVSDIQTRHTYEQAVEVVTTALEPLDNEYTATLGNGLLNGWVDRYENKGKRSGAFSSGGYEGDPYILMNFKEDDIRDVFTLAHEGGHSMHSWYSASNNPFQHYSYTIFEAEVASTFNEQLLYRHMIGKAESPAMRAYLINKQVDDIIGTLYRQTMFAEFEQKAHEMVESGEPLTVDSLRGAYRELQEKYFGEAVTLDEEADIEGLRIPHFYRAFYVYKYATGISAAIALSNRVLSGGEKELEDYFSFLKSGGSRFPIESLKAAGVDMTRPDAVNSALALFAARVTDLRDALEST